MAMKASSMVGRCVSADVARLRTLGGRAFRQHAAGIEDRDAVAILGLFHEMSGDDHGDARAAPAR